VKRRRVEVLADGLDHGVTRTPHRSDESRTKVVRPLPSDVEILELGKGHEVGQQRVAQQRVEAGPNRSECE